MKSDSEKMKYIILSVDNPPSVYLVPDVVADHLIKYIYKFYDWIKEKHKGQNTFMYSPIEDFIHYINGRFPNYPCQLIEQFGEEYWEDGWELPEKYKKYEWFNF